ncbi:hypothetical protein C8034_v000662 [Colletotrichum sidae]|uniref:Uncharacterized protein n=1 Tax=Colletotrichum sidae TaxID=1347389 RepID=A0A4R8SXC6_9PEZI|nr:hypothetical protein C8034_v000662 [Colletotrichum sidae]
MNPELVVRRFATLSIKTRPPAAQARTLHLLPHHEESFDATRFRHTSSAIYIMQLNSLLLTLAAACLATVGMAQDCGAKNGGACSINRDCCSGFCGGGVCKPDSGCNAVGKVCSGTDQCCSGDCNFDSGICR